MRIRNKNIVQLVIQAVSILLMFLPFVYNEEVWVDISGHGGHYQLMNENAFSLFNKMQYLESGLFLGILAILAMLVVTVLLIVQIAKNSHIQMVPAVGLLAVVLFFFYSVACTQEPWENGWGPSVYCEYHPAFGFVLILALQIAVVFIGFLSNARIKQNGILEEERPMLTKNNISNADELAKYKELLEKGVITQEEFDAKKKQILEL